MSRSVPAPGSADPASRLLSLLALAVLLGFCAWPLRGAEPPAPEPKEPYALSLEEVKKHVSALAALPTRVPGSKGCGQAREYILQTLRGLGYPDGTATVADGKTVAVAPAALTVAAFGKEQPGQVLPVAAQPAIRSNVRVLVKVSAAGGAVKGGPAAQVQELPEGGVVIRGTGPWDEALVEELVLPATRDGQSEVAGDKPFKTVASVTLKYKEGKPPAGAALVSATYGTRFAIGRQRFWGTAPYDAADGRLEFPAGPPAPDAPARYKLYALWPNGGAASTTLVNLKSVLSELPHPAGEGQNVLAQLNSMLTQPELDLNAIAGSLAKLAAGVDTAGLDAQAAQALRDKVAGAAGLKGPVVYAGSGTPTELEGLEIQGALVVLELSYQTKWTLVAGMGAKAVLVVEPEATLRPLLEGLYTAAPIEYPRFWLPRAEGLQLIAALKARAPADPPAVARATVHSMWRTELWENIYLLVPGQQRFEGQPKRFQFDKLRNMLKDLPPLEGAPQAALERVTKELDKPAADLDSLRAHLSALVESLDAKAGADLKAYLKDKFDVLLAELRASTVVLSACYDSNSVVPALAPGAQQALSCAALLDLARQYVRYPPARDTLFLFAAGHFQALKGEREFFGEVERFPNAKDPGKEELPDLLSDLELGQALVSGRAHAAALQAYLEGAQAPPERAKLEESVRASLGKEDAAFTELGRLERAKTEEEGQLSWPLLVAGVIALALGLFQWFRRGAARGVALFGSVTVFLVLLVHGAVLPLALRQAAPLQATRSAALQTDALLKVWKENVSFVESDLERQCRQLRSELREAPAGAPGMQPKQDELGRRDQERKTYEEAGRLLYSLSTAGATAPKAEQPELLTRPLRATAAGVLARLGEEVRWAEREQGRREVNRELRELAKARLSRASGRNCLFVSLDLSTGNPGLACFFKGAFYEQPGDDVEKKYKDFGRNFMRHAKDVEKALGAKTEGALVADTFTGSKRSWSSFQGTPLAVAAEAAVQAQVRGITLAPPYDRRLDWDSPQDQTPESGGRLSWDNLAVQLRVLGPLLRRTLADAEFTEDSRFEEKFKNTQFSELFFKAVEAGGSRSIFPSLPVTGALLQQVVDKPAISAASVRLAMIEVTNPQGQARFLGPMRGSRFSVDPVRFDPVSGSATHALNKPKNGLDENKTLTTDIRGRAATETREMFRAQGLAVLDLIDAGRLVPLRQCTLLAGRTESKPLEFGSSHAYVNEPHRVLYAEPQSRVKCLFREGQFGLRLALLNVQDETARLLLDPATSRAVSEQDAKGVGIRLGSRQIVTWLPLEAARDLWCLGENRIGNLRAHSIGNEKLDNPAFPGPQSAGTVAVEKGSDWVTGTGVHWDANVIGLPFQVLGTPEVYQVRDFRDGRLQLDRAYTYESASGRAFLLSKEKPGLHNLTQMRLKEALTAKEARRYGDAWRLATEAWGLESRAYPEVLGTAHDSVLGVVFYLFLLLPFCFFLERLLFGFPRIEQQILAFFVIFVALFIVLRFVHPAFELVAAPPIILLAFVIMSLAGIVIVILYGKFNAEMRLMQQGVRGVQATDVNRASAAVVAVSLGISQMRRRKIRTLLTCLTVVLLTFTALSFTSMVQTMAQASVPLSPGDEKDAPYNGLLLRQLNFDALRPEVFEQLQRELSAKGVVCAPRYWLVSTKKEQKVVVDVLADTGEKLKQNNKLASPSSLLGSSPRELALFGPRLTKALVAGKWLEEGDRDVCLAPKWWFVKKNEKQPAVLFEEAPEEVVRRGLKLRIGSCEVTVKGIFDPDAFNELKDLDGDMLTPVNFQASEALRGGEAKVETEVTVENLEAAAAARFDHLDSADTLVVPWQLASLMGADLRSVSAKVDDPKQLDYLLDRLLSRVEKNLFVGEDGRRYLFASTGRTSLAGMANLIVPLLISVLILLNTMIGSVYERSREITIFSSLGLAPSHIAALFFAEALVYATLGAILGYLLGQGTAKIIQWVGVTGLYLNYSSSSAVFVTALVMLAVLGSTIYPAIVAARAAAPSEERSWGVPAPQGDLISLELPFSFQRDMVPGVALFVHEYFDSHSESTLGKFTAKEVTLEAFQTQRGPGLCVFFMAWLTPYDLGVSQEVQLYITPLEENLYVSSAAFYRVSGYVNSWRRVNLPFLNALRKHFLIWRTYSPEQRQEYAVRGYQHFQKAFEAVGWPPPEGMETAEAVAAPGGTAAPAFPAAPEPSPA